MSGSAKDKEVGVRLSRIEGGGAERERMTLRLYAEPWAFSSDEFARLCAALELPRAEIFDLALRRMRHKANSSLEAAAVLAVFEGRSPSGLLAAARRSRFRVASSARAAPVRSDAPGSADPV